MPCSLIGIAQLDNVNLAASIVCRIDTDSLSIPAPTGMEVTSSSPVVGGRLVKAGNTSQFLRFHFHNIEVSHPFFALGVAVAHHPLFIVGGMAVTVAVEGFGG